MTDTPYACYHPYGGDDMGYRYDDSELEFYQSIMETIEGLTPERCEEIVRIIEEHGAAYFDMFPDPELAMNIFIEERANVNDLNDCADMVQDFVKKLENGTAEQDDLDEVVCVIFCCALLNPDRKNKLIGELTSLKTAVEQNPMAADATSKEERQFWNKMAVGGFLHKQHIKGMKPMVIAESYKKVEQLAKAIRDMILSEEENSEIGLKVQIVPESPFPEIGPDGKRYLPDTAARIRITTDDALELNVHMKEQFDNLLASAYDCKAISAGMTANGEYGISMNIFCNIPVFKWPEYTAE